MKAAPIEPLYVIFEQHLYNFQDPDMDRKTLIQAIVSDYLGYLRKNNVTVPRSLEQPVIEELSEMVNSMLVKKIYGCFDLKQFQKGLEPRAKRKARAQYSRLKPARSIKQKAG